MDRLGISDFGRADDCRDIEITLARRRRPDAHRFIGELHIFRLSIGLRMHDDRLDAQFAAGALHPKRDLAAISDQDLLEHSRLRPAGFRVR